MKVDMHMKSRSSRSDEDVPGLILQDLIALSRVDVPLHTPKYIICIGAQAPPVPKVMYNARSHHCSYVDRYEIRRGLCYRAKERVGEQENNAHSKGRLT